MSATAGTQGLIGPTTLPCDVCRVAIAVGQQTASSSATVVFDALTHWVAAGTGWLVVQGLALARGSTATDFGSAPFRGREAAMTEIALLLLVPLALGGTIGAVLRQDLRRLLRVWLVGVPVAVLATAALVAFTSLAVATVDAMCRAIVPRGDFSPYGYLQHELERSGSPMVVQLLVGVVLVIGALLLWLELVLRAVVIDVAVFFLPLGLAAVVWPTTAHVTRRFVEVLVAVIGSKFVIVGALVVGGAILVGPPGMAAAVKAVAVLLLAAFAPFALLRLVPILEMAAAAHLEGLSRRSGRAAVDVAARAASAASGTAGRLFGESGAVTGGSVGAYGIAERVGDISLSALGDGHDEGPSPQPDEPPGSGAPGSWIDPGGGLPPDRGGPPERGVPPDPGTGPGGGFPPDPVSEPGGAPRPSRPDPADLAGPLPRLPRRPPGPPLEVDEKAPDRG